MNTDIIGIIYLEIWQLLQDFKNIILTEQSNKNRCGKEMNYR